MTAEIFVAMHFPADHIARSRNSANADRRPVFPSLRFGHAGYGQPWAVPALSQDQRIKGGHVFRRRKSLKRVHDGSTIRDTCEGGSIFHLFFPTNLLTIDQDSLRNRNRPRFDFMAFLG